MTANPGAAEPAVAKRPPDIVMRLARMGAFHQTRLSFMRALLRRLKAGRWRFERPVWSIDDRGVGLAVYRATGPERAYSLVCFANDLDPAKRSDRVIATEWDATLTLYDGIPSQSDIERLSANVPLQEAGRISDRELSLSRANRSVRLFDHVVGRLASGTQPDVEMIESIGYLMRTTAVYGSGKFGAADRETIRDRPEFLPSFHLEMLSVWLTRAFSVDIAEHLAHARAPRSAVRLDPAIRRRLGVGNATGLGMAPFLVNHPRLLDRWMTMREEALARVRSVKSAGAAERACFGETLGRVRRNVAGWITTDPVQTARIAALQGDVDRIADQVAAGALDAGYPWDELYRWAEDSLTLEGQELLVSLVLEPHGTIIDDLADGVHCDESTIAGIDGAMTVARLREIVGETFAWALDTDYTDRAECARFWYVSQAKLEPRLGERFEEGDPDLELPLSIGRDIAALMRDLNETGDETTIARFLFRHPQYRDLVRRVRIAVDHPYSEIRDNLIAADMRPIDLLRCKLSFFGATNFDPRSDRWVRINMYRGAPFPDEFDELPADDWAFGGEELAR